MFTYPNLKTQILKVLNPQLWKVKIKLNINLLKSNYTND